MAGLAGLEALEVQGCLRLETFQSHLGGAGRKGREGSSEVSTAGASHEGGRGRLLSSCHAPQTGAQGWWLRTLGNIFSLVDTAVQQWPVCVVLSAYKVHFVYPEESQHPLRSNLNDPSSGKPSLTARRKHFSIRAHMALYCDSPVNDTELFIEIHCLVAQRPQEQSGALSNCLLI